MCQDCEPALVAEIRAYSVTEYEIERHGSHRALLFTYDGRPVRLVYGTNPSDRHHLLNAISDLRRAMGVRRIIVKRRGPRATRPPRRSAPPPVLAPPSAAPISEPWAPLQAWIAKYGSVPPEPPAAPVTAASAPIRLQCPQFGRRERWQQPP